MRRIEQVNELLREELAKIISEEIPMDNGLITISFVNCAENLKSAKVGVSVMPEKLFKTTLEKLNKRAGLFSQLLKQRIRLRKIPRFYWIADETERRAGELEKVFEEIRHL